MTRKCDYFSLNKFFAFNVNLIDAGNRQCILAHWFLEALYELQDDIEDYSIYNALDMTDEQIQAEARNQLSQHWPELKQEAESAKC